jgi:hypothetical protein
VTRQLIRLPVLAVAATGLLAVSVGVAMATGVPLVGTDSKPTPAYPSAHFKMRPFSLGILNQPQTGAERAAAARPEVAEEVGHVTAGEVSVPDEWLPGEADADTIRIALDGVGTQHRSIWIVRTTKGRICAGLTDFTAGCIEGLPPDVAVTALSADPDALGTGEAPLVWGIRRDNVKSVDVIVNGHPYQAVLGRNAYFLQLPDPATSDRAIERVVAHLANGETFSQEISHGPAIQDPKHTTVGPPEVPSR